MTDDELAMLQNPERMASIKRGVEQAKRGEVTSHTAEDLRSAYIEEYGIAPEDVYSGRFISALDDLIEDLANGRTAEQIITFLASERLPDESWSSCLVRIREIDAQIDARIETDRATDRCDCGEDTIIGCGSRPDRCCGLNADEDTVTITISREDAESVVHDLFRASADFAFGRVALACRAALEGER